VIDTDLYKGILALVTGCLTGSFLNVVIYRMPREKSLVLPGSKCPGCDNPIAFYDNIPVISWLALKAKCRRCGEKISIRYPIVELITGILFYLIYQNFDIGLNWIFLSYFASLMVVITWIDIDFMLILHSITYPAIVVGFIYSYINNTLPQSILGFIIGTVLFYLIAKLSFLMMKKEGMGMGDVALAALLGTWLGLNNLLGSLFISFLLGSVIGLIFLALKGRSEHFPFGPSLAAGALITLLSNNYVFSWYINNFL